MGKYINFEENYQKNKKNKEEKNESGYINFEAEYQANIFKNSLPSRLEEWEKERNSLYDSYKSRFYDKDGKFINKYRQDTKSAYDSYLESQKKLDTEAQEILSFLDNNGDYFDEKYVAQLKSYLTDNSNGLSSLMETYKSDNDYWGQWEDEDAYNRDYDHYTYTNKYKGKSYADLQKARAELEAKASANQNDEALSRELYWLENHSTDRQFADTMTTEELGQYKADHEGKVKELQSKISKLKTEKAAHERGGQTGKSNQRYQTILKELESAEAELKGIDEKSVLYYDDDEVGITTDTLLNMRAADEKFNTQNVDTADLAKDLEIINRVKLWLTNEQSDATKTELDYANANPQAKQDMEYLKAKYNIDDSGLPFDVFENVADLEEYVNWRVAKSNYAENIKEDKRFAKEHPVLATGKSILTAPLTALEYAGNVLGDSNLRKDEYGSQNLVNIYDDEFSRQNEVYQSTVSATIGDKVYKATGNEVLSWLSSTAYSGATSAAQSGMTALACTALFGGAGTYIASAIMGSEAASSSYRSAIMNGSTNGEALTFSIASGVAEGFFEWASLDKLVGNVLKAGWDTNSLSAFFKSSLKNSGKVFGQGLVEASEEFATELSNKVADAIINGDTSAYETAVRKYKSQGYSDTDAKELAQKDFLDDVVNSMIGGFFGGIGMGGVVNTANQLRAGKATASNIVNENNFYKQTGQEIVEADNVGQLVESAKALTNSSKSLQKLANEVAGVKTEDGLTDKQSKSYAKNVGKLYKGVQEAQFEGVKNADRVAFKSMVKAELEGSDDIKNIDKVAEIITKAQFETLSPMEQKTFDNVNGLEVLNKVNNSKDLNANTKQTKNENMQNFLNTSALTVSEKEAIAKYTGYDISDDGKTYIDATDEEVSIKNFKSVSGGDIVVELDNGSSISVGELRVDSDIAMIAKGLDSLNSVFSIDAQAANYIYDLWTGTENVKASDFMDGMRSAMALAKTNNVKGLETDANTKELPETLRKAMFDVARNIEESKTQARQGAIDKAVESRRESKKGKARKEGTGTVKYDGIKESDLNSSQKAQVDFLSTIFTTMGINVEFFASPVKDGKHVGESGLYRPRTNTIRIDIFAGAEGKGLMLYTASHELTHFIREWSPAKFKVFADFLMENYNENNVPVKQLIQAKINNSIALAKEDKTRKVLTYDLAYEEVVADACEKFLADSNAKDMLVALAQQDQTLAQKILKWIKDFANLIKNALDAIKGIEPDSRESAYVQEMTDVLEGLRYLWDEALFDAMESYQWVGKRVNQNEIAGIDYDALEAAKNENGEELLQIRAIQHDVPEYRALLEKYGTLNAVEIDNLFNTMEKAFAIIEENLEILDYAWEENLNEDGTWDDSTDARAFKPVKPNSDKLYKYSLDFSTLCRKRLLQQVIVEELSMALDRAVTKAESIAIRDELIKLQEEGRQLEIACALCYVESARMKSPEQIQKFINDAGQKVREFFAAKAKGDVVVAEENARKRLAKQYAQEIKEGKMPSPTDTVTTKSGKKKYIALSQLPSNVAWEIRNAKREAKASYNPTAEEQELIDIANALPTSTFTTAEGLKNLAKEHPVIFDAYTSFVRNATHSKGTEKDVWYRVGDADVIGDDLIAAMNKENGLRSQSWSDFQVIHLLDYVGAIIELSTKQAKMQSYTKVEDYVNLMGLTNMMINLSLIPTREFNGKLDFDSVEGMGFKIALALREKYPDTAGTISIGVADEQIKLLLESADIDYVIPYHHSGMSKVVRKTMHIPTWDSYQDFQGEKKITSRKDAMANAKKHGVKLLDTSDANYHKAPNFSEWFDLELARKTAEYENIRPSDAKAQKKYGVMYGAYKAMQEAADNYIKLCAERGLQPKFSYGKGDFSTEQNYWKLLIDRKMINQKTGEIIEQQAVKPIFNEGEVLNILNNEIARYENIKEDFDYATHYVVERFLNGDMSEHIKDIAKHIGETVNNVTTVAAVGEEELRQDRDSTGRELTPEQTEFFKDSKIRDEDGNLRVVYHGTPNGDFNTFRISDGSHSSLMAQYGAGYYFDSNRDSAARYTKNVNKSSGKTNPKVFEVYLNITNPLEIHDEYIGDGKDRVISKQQFAEVVKRGNYEWMFTNGMPFELQNYLGKTKADIQQMPREDVISHWVDMVYDRAYLESDILSSMVKAYRGDSILTVMKDVFGKDGVKVIDRYGEMYVAWDNNSIKSVDNLNPTEDEDIRYQDRAYAPTFYSQMGKVVESVKQDKLGASSVVPMLKGKGIKNEEIKWSGIEAFLDGKKSVTKQELLDFIAGSMLQIEETMLEDTVSEIEFDDVEEKRYGELADKAESLREELAKWWNEAFGEELPQAIALADYRKTSSVALDIVQDKNPKAIYRDEYNQIVRKLQRIEDSIELLYQFAEDRAVSINTKWSKYKLENGSNYREIIFKMPNSTYSNDAMKSHWTQENKGVLAHARIQDLIVDGKNMLFIEEIQSDWHNEGATKGYASDSRIAKLDQIYQQMGKALHDFDNPNHMQEAAKLRDEWHELESELKSEGLNTNAIPDAPFRDNYHEYVLKRLIRMAAEEGYDSIGWTTADIQSKRWSEEYAEGYRIEYDQDIPKFLNKYGKKWGAKVDKSQIDTGITSDFDREMAAQGYIDIEPTYTEIWSMDITEPMKDSVLYDGQTLYQARQTNIDKITKTSHNKRSYYNESNSLFMRWSNSASTPIGDLRIFQRNNKTWALYEKTEDGCIEIIKGNYKEVEKEYERAYKEANDTLYGHIEEFRLGKRGNIRNMFSSQDGSNDGRGVQQIGSKRLQTDTTGDDEYLLSGDKGELELRQDRPLSNREILVDAMSNIEELSIEDRNRLETYKTKIDSINALEKELADIGGQIHKIITTQGSDREQVKTLSAKAETLRKKISRVDGQLLKIEAMQPIQKLVEIRRKQILTSYKKEVQEQRKKSVDQRYRTATKGKIKRVVNELNSILNNGTKERNVKFGLQDTVNKALEMAKLLNAKFSNEEVLMADTMTTLTEKEKKLVDEYRQLVANRDSYNERIEKLQQNTENTNYKLIDELAQMRNKAYKEIKKLEKQLSDVIERNRTNLNDTLISDAINSLATSYKALEKSQDEFIKGVYSEYVYDRIAAFGETIKGTKMQDMTLGQLQEMYDIYKMVMATVRASNQLFMGGKRADINKAVSGVLFELDKRNKAKALPYELADKALDAARDFSYKEMKPVYFFERLGSQTLKEIFFDEARKAEDIFARDTEDAKKFIQTMRAKHGYKSWDMEKGFDITLSSGRKLKLTLGEIMSIYAYSKREQALEHMTNGGFVFDSKEYFKDVKVKDENGKKKREVREQGGIPYRVNEFDFVKIKQILSDEQIKYVDEMQDYLSSVMGAKGNEVSRILYGIDLFKEKYYFPLMSSKDFVTERNQPVEQASLKNTGMAKATVPHAKNPIVLQSFEDVWANHVGKMSTYHALVLPIENMNKVLNYAEYVGDDVDSVSVKGIIGNLFTESATDYIKTYITDLNGGIGTQGAKNPFAKMFTNFKKTAVAASMSTVVQQPTAILRAMAMINPKYFSLKPSSYEEIKKYAPIAIIKEMGGFDAGSGRTASGYILEETYEGGKEKFKAFFKDGDYRDSKLMWGAEKGDELGWGIIWSAVKKEVADTTTYAKGSEEFLQACGERFTEVISYTQVYDSVFSRSEYMRSKNDLVKMSTAFMGEPTTSFNMLYNAVLQAKRGNISKAQAVGTISAVSVSIIMAAVAKSFIYALRDDDDDESYLYKYTESLKSNLISDMHIHNMLPFVSDVASLFSGWDVERTDMAIFKDIKDAWDGIDSDSKSTYRKIEDLSGAIAALGGIPWKNVMRTFREGYNFFANIFDDNTGYDGGTPASSEVNELLDKGKDAKAKATIKEILENKTEKYVKEGYSKAEAEKKAKSSLKSSVTSYWKELYLEAYDNKDNAEMLRIRKILQSTGLYDNVVETCQNWIKNKKNTTETDSEWDKW